MAQEPGFFRGVEVPDILRENAWFITGVVVVVALLAWLTAAEGAINWRLILFVLAVSAAYGVVGWTSRLTRRNKENLHFVIVALGVFGILAILSRPTAPALDWSTPLQAVSTWFTSWNYSYLVFVTITILIFALFALGLNLEFGYTGIINFGHVAFMGIGAYTTTLASRWFMDPVRRESVLGALTGPTVVSLILVALTALVAAVIVAAAVSTLVSRALGRASGLDAQARSRASLAAGVAVGLLAAAGVVAAVSYPLSETWAVAYLVGGTVLLGMALAAAFGVLIGIPTLRLREDYLAIVTIGAAEIVRRSWVNEIWLTDGPRGVVGFPLPLGAATTEWPWLVELADYLNVGNTYKLLLFLMVALSIVVVFFMYEVLVHSPYGRVLKAIREDEEVAQALGKNVFTYKLQALAVGSAVAGLAGALFAWQNVYINPDAFEPIFTFYAWIIIVLGGIGNNKGTILGALILFTFFESTRFLNLDTKLGLTSTQGAAFRVVLIGVLLIVFMMFKPEGILGRKEEMVLGD